VANTLGNNTEDEPKKRQTEQKRNKTKLSTANWK